jgi:hypothetical protein
MRAQHAHPIQRFDPPNLIPENWALQAAFPFKNQYRESRFAAPNRHLNGFSKNAMRTAKIWEPAYERKKGHPPLARTTFARLIFVPLEPHGVQTASWTLYTNDKPQGCQPQLARRKPLQDGHHRGDRRPHGPLTALARLPVPPRKWHSRSRRQRRCLGVAQELKAPRILHGLRGVAEQALPVKPVSVSNLGQCRPPTCVLTLASTTVAWARHSPRLPDFCFDVPTLRSHRAQLLNAVDVPGSFQLRRVLAARRTAGIPGGAARRAGRPAKSRTLPRLNRGTG